MVNPIHVGYVLTLQIGYAEQQRDFKKEEETVSIINPEKQGYYRGPKVTKMLIFSNCARGLNCCKT